MLVTPMCMFTGSVGSVANTEIFARARGDRQLLAYGMSLETPRDTAMVLPLPVLPGGPEDAVRFVSLAGYPDLFDDLGRAFPEVGETLAFGAAVVAAAPTLTVHQVGSFEASYVPAQRDFERLDPRFRLPDGIWRALPLYHDYGFAVFKLRSGRQRVHPMALEFPTRARDALYFPTVHVHDQVLRERADFDHQLYAQGPICWNLDWQGSHGDLGRYVKTGNLVRSDPTRGLVDPASPGFRRTLRGVYENRDTWLFLAAPAAR